MATQPQQPTTSSIVWSVVLWLFFAYLFIQILQFNQGTNSNLLLGGMYFILFGIHEAAHVVFGLLPSVFVASAGSVSEIIFASLLVVAAIRSHAAPAAITFTILWFMLALTSAGNYMADAQDQIMPLVGMGPNPMHDWHFVFNELGLLAASPAIGTSLKIVGAVIAAGSLAWYLARIVTRNPAVKNSPLQQNAR